MFDQIIFQAEAFITKFPAEAARCNGRIERAIQIAQAGAVTRISDTTYSVQSSTTDQTYTVDTSRKTCTCIDAQKGHTCKHRLAVAFQFTLVVPEDRQLITGIVRNNGQDIPVIIGDIYYSPAFRRNCAYVYTRDGSSPFLIHGYCWSTYESTDKYPVDLIHNIQLEEAVA